MADISTLEGITSGEVKKLCEAKAKIDTVELFLARLDASFTEGITSMSEETKINRGRLVELVPLKNLQLEALPDDWVEELVNRMLHEAKPDDPWLKRCGQGWRRFRLGLKGHWKGWKKNLPIVGLLVLMLMLFVLTLQGAGALSWLPHPMGERGQVLVTADVMEAGQVLKPNDLYSVLLPLRKDYFKPGDNLEGAILSRRISGQTALRFQDVLRPQVIATKDIQADAIIQKDDITLEWKPYQPGAALTLEEVFEHKATQALRKDGIILSDFVKPAK